MDTENNQLILCGVIETAPVLDHEVFGEQFYRLDLRVPRLSGAQDLLPVTVSDIAWRVSLSTIRKWTPKTISRRLSAML